MDELPGRLETSLPAWDPIQRLVALGRPIFPVQVAAIVWQPRDAWEPAAAGAGGPPNETMTSPAEGRASSAAKRVLRRARS